MRPPPGTCREDRPDDVDPIPVRPWEPPGPPPRRRFTFGRPMVIFWAVVVVVFLAATLLMCTVSKYGPSPG